MKNNEWYCKEEDEKLNHKKFELMANALVAADWYETEQGEWTHQDFDGKSLSLEDAFNYEMGVR